MIDDSKYTEVFRGEWHGERHIAVKILVYNKDQEVLKTEDLLWEVGEKIHHAVERENIKHSQEEQSRALTEKAMLLGLFSNPVWAKAIPNGYCSRYCCEHLPWFVVTTTLGPITIGWRKRVINIDWSESDIKKSGEELFADQDVTKDKHMIHAYGYDKAREYITKLMETK